MREKVSHFFESSSLCFHGVSVDIKCDGVPLNFASLHEVLLR